MSDQVLALFLYQGRTRAGQCFGTTSQRPRGASAV